MPVAWLSPPRSLSANATWTAVLIWIRSAAPFRAQLAEQHQAGIGVKREGFEKALQFLRDEIEKWDLAGLAAGLGAAYQQVDGSRPCGSFTLEKG